MFEDDRMNDLNISISEMKEKINDLKLLQDKNSEKMAINEQKINDCRLNRNIKILGYLVVGFINMGLANLGVTGDMLTNITLLNILVWSFVGSIFNGTIWGNIETINYYNSLNLHLDSDNQDIQSKIKKLVHCVNFKNYCAVQGYDEEKKMLNDSIEELRDWKYRILNDYSEDIQKEEKQKQLVKR